MPEQNSKGCFHNLQIHLDLQALIAALKHYKNCYLIKKKFRRNDLETFLVEYVFLHHKMVLKYLEIAFTF